MALQKCLFSFTAALAFIATGSCGDNSPFGQQYPDYRYRLTVEVDTPEGLKSGSSVIEVQTSMSGGGALLPNKLSTKVMGEAVTVDLGKRGVFFALLRTDYSVDWASGVLMSSTKPVTYEEVHDEIERTNRDPSFDISMKRTLVLTGKHEVQRFYGNNAFRQEGKPFPPSYYPIMVRFKNLYGPASVEEVDPDNLAKTFGAGVKLKRLTVERTEDPVTTGIEKRLTWLPNVRGSLTRQPRDPVTGKLVPLHLTSLSVQLTQSDFMRSVPQ